MVTNRDRLGWLAGVFVLLMSMLSNVQAGTLPDFTDLVKENSPAVVNISTTQKAGRQGAGLPFNEEDLQQLPEIFRHFFGVPGQPGPGPRQGPRPERQSMGSGFIVSSDGYILTNNHVVDGADEIMVRLNDRRELAARLVGADPRADLAVLKVDADDLPVARLGKSSALEVGEWVVAIGSPFGFDYTVTAGIVSAIGRSLPNENYVPFIQTDVAINPGNSGGPLYNLDGEVVGINSQIYTRSGGFMGVSFAIPIDVAMDVFRQLKDKGYVSRGWLGVLIQEVNRDLADSFGLSKPHGALVAEVMSGSPAEKAGVKPGDVIVEFDGHEIQMSSELPHHVGRVAPGAKADLTVVRQGKTRELAVVIGELPKDDEIAASPASPGKASGGGRLGIQVAALTDEQKKRFEVEGGVLVTQVGEGPGFEAGVRQNDVIRSLNNQDVDSVKAYEKVVKDLPTGKAIPVLVVRDGNPSFLVLKLKD